MYTMQHFALLPWWNNCGKWTHHWWSVVLWRHCGSWSVDDLPSSGLPGSEEQWLLRLLWQWKLWAAVCNAQFHTVCSCGRCGSWILSYCFCYCHEPWSWMYYFRHWFTCGVELSLHKRWLPVQSHLMGEMHGAKRRGDLASHPVLHAPDHGFNPGGAVCHSGGERPAGSFVWGLLWMLWREWWSSVNTFCSSGRPQAPVSCIYIMFSKHDSRLFYYMLLHISGIRAHWFQCVL